MTKEKLYFGEEWKDVQMQDINPEHKYQISNYGRLRRWRKDLDDWNYLSVRSNNPNQLIYYSFGTTLDWKKRKPKPLHRCVAECFCYKPSPEHNNVIHLDYVRHNNKATNLKWVTKKELYEHNNKNPKILRDISGMLRAPTNAKLTPTNVIRLKKKLARAKMPLYKIAKEFGITHTQLNRIRSGENWGDITID